MRIKKDIVMSEESRQEAKAICDNFKDFIDGVRVLMLIHRSKDGAKNSTRHQRMVVTKDSKNFEETLAEFLDEKKRSKDNLRIYSTANSRSLKKSVMDLKIRQIEVDYSPDDVFNDFCLSIKNRFISCIMQPKNRNQGFFVMDIDNPMTLDMALAKISKFKEIDVVLQYPTKNGWHIVTHPFNPNIIDIPVNKDGLLLLSF
jgi:hypothetical protein